MNDTFPHHRLDVYRRGLELVAETRKVIDAIPKGHRKLADQLARSVTAVPLLSAEGANRQTSGRKRQRFSEARGEANEVAAALEIIDCLGIVRGHDLRALQTRAGEVAAMLTGLIRRHS